MAPPKAERITVRCRQCPYVIEEKRRYAELKLKTLKWRNGEATYLCRPCAARVNRPKGGRPQPNSCLQKRCLRFIDEHELSITDSHSWQASLPARWSDGYIALGKRGRPR